MSEMSEHRVPMLGASWRRFEDPTHSRDPRVRALVGALATLPGPEMREEFRTELRAQLVAIAPRIVAESSTATDTKPHAVAPDASARGARVSAAPAQHSDTILAKLRTISIGRPLAVVASVVTVFALLLGGAVWMSKKALPGDTLYGLKRASESTELAFAGSDTKKAQLYLDFASERAREARGLLGRTTASATGAQADALDSHTADLIDSTLSSADSDVTKASALLGNQAVEKNSTSPLNLITSWAPGQLARLHDLADAMPAGDLRSRAESSAHLVVAAVTRANDLAPIVTSNCADQVTTDTLGPVPAGGCAATLPSQSTTQKTTNAPAPNKSHSTGSGSSGGTSGADSGTAGPRASTSNGSSSSGGGLLPSLPIPTSSAPLPVSVDSCGVGATLGPLEIGLGLCSGVKVNLTP
jgi:uncharacterized membrane protein YgcG